MTRLKLLVAASATCAIAALCFVAAYAHEKPPVQEQPAQHDEPGIRLSEKQVAAGNFAVQEARGGLLSKRMVVPGAIVPSGDRIAKVSVRLLGTVAEVRKRLGDTVREGDVLAIIESREVADAKSQYLAARVAFDLQDTLFTRSKSLFESKVSSENDFLRAKTAFEDIRIKFDVARQKLFALGLTSDQIAVLPQQPVESLRLQELRAPMNGRIAERRIDLGSLVGREGQESELFVIVDSSVVWAELSLAAADLAVVSEGQKITISAGSQGEPLLATIMFVSPLLDKDTRLARVVASVDNPAHILRPGMFVTAEIPFQQVKADVVVPKTAVQSIEGQSAVFVRTPTGFEPRKIVTGREDSRSFEVTSGLSAGDPIATANTFVLKADLGRGEASHAH
ncbi:MAG TPA: efflux RND transporter periplasmic adaptor subunit [Afipia sp.]|uniref:efflux RND transporter periplasmic adaptor subunit n=1 Tax=unclassified Afipia TaxID=2642050 RepID=UPI000465894E|nr:MULTISPECIES: efflux RND transporter periplasmic adaptor subunit [unclassified Afipia]MAH71560.1 efflux RND transporter periplasmic adaptor subunit [Afipia sp.]OUX59400.1 MAG: efflux transporter periplasmic adaptor subunit [Afipia sp. TMED4]HAP13722.1 efflux RND transporter periplasmic adaptor subunit [Afipia sp.]HAP49385.1 efflux RND transporter periplasmic adaptor subunit [Afipia sp.]HAQ91827.1 efflux RND transporter periplasmic adaptor subunit [Afipia sp.]